MAVFLSDCLISLKESRPEHSCFSSMWHLETVCKDIDTQSQAFSFSRSEYLTQPIQMQLSPNQKNFSECFSSFPQSTYNLKYFENKDDPQRLLLSQIIDTKMRGYLNGKKAPCQNTYGQSRYQTVRNTAWICTAVFLSYFFITLKENQLQKFCFSCICNLETVC